MARFFVSPDDIQNGEILLTGENAQHGKVLRLQPGELIDVCDGMGYDYRCAVQEIDNKTIRVSISGKDGIAKRSCGQSQRIHFFPQSG